MKKRTRFIIFLLCLGVGIYFLLPTIQWYYQFSDLDKADASFSGDKLKEQIDIKVLNAFSKLKANSALENELKYIRSSYKKESAKINKANPANKILYNDKISFADMNKELSKVRKQKFVDNFFRTSLEEFYGKYYEKKKSVKDRIIKLGLDLQGGAYAVVTLNFNSPNALKNYPKEKFPNGIPKVDKDAMIDSAVIKIENRINKYGISETSIQKLKDQEKIIINLPGVKEATELRSVIETVGVLEFKVVSKQGSDTLAGIKLQYDSQNKSIFGADGKLLPEIQAQLPPDTQALFVSNKDKYGKESDVKQMLVVEKESLLGENVQILNATTATGDLGQNVVNFELGGDDSKKWAKVTGDNIGKQIAIILDDVILQSPTVQSKITGGRSQITLGDSPIEELRTLALILKSGSMTVPLEISEENSVGASLGQDTISKGLFAMFMGFFFVILFMFLWYNVGGIIADIAVALNVLLLVGLLALFKGTLTLPG